MRLGQLARKLDLDTSEIIKFLKKKDIEVENHLNTKLEAYTVDLVLKAFEPIVEVVEEKIIEPIAEIEEEQIEEIDVVEEIKEETITPEEVVLEPIIENKPEATAPPKATNTLTVSELIEKEGTTDETIEKVEREIVEFSREDKIPEDLDVAIIRAPKVELQGIKVLGKIELPEKFKKGTKVTAVSEKDANDSTTDTIENTSTPIVQVGKHPNKTKIKTKKIILPDSEIKKEDETPSKPKKAKEIKAEKKAKEKGNKKKSFIQHQEEQSERQKIREKRKKQREKQKEAPKKSQKSWLRQLWDAIK